MSNLRRIVCLTVASTAMFPGAASAASWGAPTTLSTHAQGPISATAPLVAADGAGNLTAVWIRKEPGSPGPATALETATKPVGGAWSAATKVGEAWTASALTLSVSPNGHVIAGWLTQESSRSRYLEVATRTPSGTWSSVERIQPPSTNAAPGFTSGFGVGIGSSGEATGVWQRDFTLDVFGNSAGTEFLAGSRSLGGAWSATNPGVGVPKKFSFGIDGAGNSTLLFQAADGSLKATTRPAGGAWSAATQITGGSVPAGPSDAGVDPLGPPIDAELEVAPSGAAVVTWHRRNNKLGYQELQWARRAPGGVFGAEENLFYVNSGEDGSFGDIDADTDAAGNSTAAWTATIIRKGSTSSRLYFATASEGEKPSSSTIAASEPSGRVSVDAAGAGKALIAWQGAAPLDAASGAPIVAALRTGPYFGTAEQVGTTTAASTDLGNAAIDAAGNASVVWGDANGIYAADTTAPVATPVATPKPSPTPVVTPSPTPVATPTPKPSPTPVVTPTPTPKPTTTPVPSAAPSISSVSGVAYGSLGGIAIINGKNFSDVTAVNFGTKKASTGFAVGTGVLVVVAPPQNVGSYRVSVETKAGISADPISFTYKKLF